jgi:hypothetical protein
MNEPIRWRQTGPEEVRALLRHVEGPKSMTASDRDRMARRVARIAAIPAGIGVLFWVKGVALGAGIGALSLAAAVSLQQGWFAGHGKPANPQTLQANRPAPAVSIPSASAKQEPSAPPIASVVAPVSLSPSVGFPSSVAIEVDAAADSRMDSLAEEATLLEQARAAIGSSPAHALELTELHASRFPKGQLGMEREIVAIEALKALGRMSEARARADALLARARGSLYEDRIRNLFPAAPAASSSS